MLNSDNNQPVVAVMDLELVNYFLKKFVLNCEKGNSMESLDRNIRQLRMVFDSFIIYNMVKNGQIKELNDQNSNEIFQYFGA